MNDKNLTPARTQDPWKVELFVHATKDFIVYMHTSKDMYDDIRTRNKSGGEEVVMYAKRNIASQVQNLIPINQIHREIPNVVPYAKWRIGPLRRKLEAIGARARRNERNRYRVSIVSIKEFVAGNMVQNTWRGDFKSTK